MILIFNLSGLLLGLFSLVIAVLAIGVTMSPAVGCVVVACVWFVFGGRRVDRRTGLKRAYPSVFFVPLRFAAIAPLILGGLFFALEHSMRSMQADPQYAMLVADEAMVRTERVAGDVQLSQSVRESVRHLRSATGMDIGSFHVLSRIAPDAVLVLAQDSRLRGLSAAERERLLRHIESVVRSEFGVDVDVYVGMKDTLRYRAMLLPSGSARVEGLLVKSDLMPFYDSIVDPQCFSEYAAAVEADAPRAGSWAEVGFDEETLTGSVYGVAEQIYHMWRAGKHLTQVQADFRAIFEFMVDYDLGDMLSFLSNPSSHLLFELPEAMERRGLPECAALIAKTSALFPVEKREMYKGRWYPDMNLLNDEDVNEILAHEHILRSESKHLMATLKLMVVDHRDELPAPSQQFWEHRRRRMAE